MTDKLEIALEQTANIFMEMAKEIKSMRTKIEDLQIIVDKHEAINNNISQIFQNFNGGNI